MQGSASTTIANMTRVAHARGASAKAFDPAR